MHDKVKTVGVMVARRTANREEGDDKVIEMSYGNLEGTDQGNVKLLFEDNVQGFKELLPVLLKDAITSNDLFIGQDFVSI